jgi:prepilin-type N-terminal cleavage/methylation domain-containing protein
MSAKLHQLKQRAGFSLLEMIVAMTVMSVIAAVIMPVIVSSTDAYAVARDTRADTDRVLYALERSARLVREAPFLADESGLAVQISSATQFILVDGSGIRLSGNQLELLKPGGQSSVLCSEIDRVQFSYFDNAGNAMAIVNPSQIHRVCMRIQSGAIRMEMYAMPRSWIGRGGGS